MMVIKEEFAPPRARPRLIPFTLTYQAGDSENEKGSDEEERLDVVGTDSLSAGKHCANELALRSAETGAKNDRKATTIRRTRRLSRARLQDLGTAK